MKLYYSPASPYVRKVNVCAIERGVDARIERLPTKVVPSEPNREYGKANPLMKVPALETDDGQVLFDSAVICEYLDGIGDKPRLFPADGAARWRALRLHAVADGILDAAILVRYETAVRPQELRWDAWIQGQLLKVDQALDFLERNLGELERFDIGSVGAGCALGYLDFRYADRPWRGRHRKLAAWYERIASRPSFAGTVPHA